VKLLLDTHIWIWLLHSSERLGSRTHQELGNVANELWVSPISTWEALLQHRKKRVELSVDFLAWVKQSTPGFHQAPFTHEIVLAAEHLDIHADPAGRFLAATAQVLDLTFVTADQRLLGLGSVRTMANR
jgi:PIN domain nuclease of toxin-antitoxin system